MRSTQKQVFIRVKTDFTRLVEGEPDVVHVEEVGDGGVESVDVDFVLHSAQAEVVGAAVGFAAFTTTASPHHVT